MRKMVLKLYVMPQIRRHEFYLVPDDHAEDETYMDDYAWEAAVQFAESYGFYPASWLEEDEGLEGNHNGQYTDSIEGNWQVYDPERHDGYKTRGEIHWNEM